jgi:hypothetical protein
MRDAQVRPRHHHLLDQRPEGPDAGQATIRPPRPATSASPRRWRRKARARHHRQRHLPGLYRTPTWSWPCRKRGAGNAHPAADPGRPSRRAEEIARAVVFLAPPTRPASSPARRSRPTAASTDVSGPSETALDDGVTRDASVWLDPRDGSPAAIEIDGHRLNLIPGKRRIAPAGLGAQG